MFECRKHGYGENIRLMRQSTASRMNEQKSWSDEEIVCLRNLFYLHEGISHMALLFSCTEIEVMNKVLELNLYDLFFFPLYHNYLGDTPNTHEEEMKGGYNCDPYTQSVEVMRRATGVFCENSYYWSKVHDEILQEMFESNADVTTIALSFVCTEVMIMRKIIELGLYSKAQFGSDMGPYADTVVYYPALHDYV